MGSPAVIRFWEDNTDEHPLGLYLHCGAETYAEDLAVALRVASGRWDDPEYATRMAVQAILERQGIRAGDLGSGLFVGTEDHGGPVLNVNWGSKTVWNDSQRIPFEQYSREWKAVS